MPPEATREADQKEAKNFLRGQHGDPQDMFDLAKRLKDKWRDFGLARRVLDRVRNDPRSKKQLKSMRVVAQQQALCTYKDANLHADLKFQLAFDILCLGDDIVTTTDQETLGIAGAIHKYKWESFGQTKYLEESLSYYMRGYNVGPASDYGYTGINAAFVLDLLASLEARDQPPGATPPQTVVTRRNEAQEIRKVLIDVLPKLSEQPEGEFLKGKWWFVVTLAEAYFGLRRYTEARKWLDKATKLPNVAKWEYETTARQLATLARLQQTKEKDTDLEPWKVLEEFLGGETEAVRSAFLGRVGLALSGGGFRASLFHIGVLARLAELDALRHIEFISCVSGGAIVGMYYYLEVRELLQRKSDNEITQQDYIDIVESMVEKFRLGVQKNVRTRVAADLRSNLRMISENYTRTDRAGELYESELYSEIKYAKGQPQFMSDLLITPKKASEEEEDFDPKVHNWRRKAKVPILVINATTLNTGHNFQFTATWMGEPPSGIDAEVDSNYRLRRMYYKEAPAQYQEVRIGRAVGASACVPGVFEPIPFQGLYRDLSRNQDVFARLVDGGVHDNQGVASLLDQDCRILLVSDASGQMVSEDHPAGGVAGPLLRTNSIFQSRLREAEFQDLENRRRSSLLRGLMFIHLKKDLKSPIVDWKDTKDPYPAEDYSTEGRGILTKYGVDRELQLALSGIRTDLDSFSDAEAFALMASAYRMTDYEFPLTIHGLAGAEKLVDWDFNKLLPAMNREDETAYQHLKRLLEVGAKPAFKVWYLSRGLTVAGIAILAVVAAGVLALLWYFRDTAVITWGAVLSFVVLLVAGLVVGKGLLKIVRFRDTLQRLALMVGMGVFGWALANLHLRVFDPMFLERGTLARVFAKSSKPAGR
jgi:predicted acylesterase/phospholipase RssA